MSTIVKIPVLISDFLPAPVDNYREMVERVEQTLENYNNYPDENKYQVKYRGKLKWKVIKTVNHDNYIFDGNVPTIQLRVEEFKKGNQDLYLQQPGNNATTITANDALGSEHNFAMMYPILEFDDNGNARNRWATFIYDDPSKDDADLHNTIKTVLTKILSYKVISVLHNRLSEAIQDGSTVEKITVTYATKEVLENGNVELTAYNVSVKEKSTREVVYVGVPKDDALRLANNSDLNGYQSKTVTVQVTDGTKYKFVYEVDPNMDAYLSLLEQDNCYRIELTDEELTNMHNPIIVKNKLQSVINQFLLNE